MTIPALSLDDLTWAQMMDAIRERIPGAASQWTLHAPVDPGITLLELYAYLLEQRLFLLDQVPESVVRGVLGLLGVAPPAPAIPAATVLLLRPSPVPVAPPGGPPAAVPPALDAVPAGTELFRPAGAGRIVFSTEQGVALLPPEPVRLEIAGVDRTADLRISGVILLDAGAGAGQPPPAELVLTSPAAFDPPAEAWLSLLLELDTRATIRPSWDPLAPSDVPPPAQITWSYQDAADQFQPFAPDQLDDGTGNLRRSGVVRLAWPDAWRPGAPTGPAPPASTVERRLRLSTSHATFTAPPRLIAISVNAVAARHRQLVTVTGPVLERLDAQLDNWLRLPGQTLDLDAATGQPGSVAGLLLDDPTTIQLTLAERDGRQHAWVPAADLGTYGPADRVFQIDRAAGTVRFGDGLTGRVPVIAQRRPGDPPRLSLSYQLGGGELGNLGVVEWACAALPIEATSAVPASSGTQPETIEQARSRAGDELARPTRAVTIADIEQLTEQTPGVDIARAHVAVGLHPATPCDPVAGAVTVVIVPGLPGDRSDGRPDVLAPNPDPGAIAAVTSMLAAVRLIGTEVFVRGPRYRPVRLAVTPGSAVATPAGLQQRLLDGLRRYLDPLAGGPDEQGWPFGEPLRPSELLGVAQGVAGRAAVITAVSIGLDGAPPSQDCQDVAIGPHDLVVLTRLTLVAPPSGIEPGGLS